MPRCENTLGRWTVLALCVAGCTSVPPLDGPVVVRETIYLEPDTCVECVIEDVLGAWLAEHFPTAPDAATGPDPDTQRNGADGLSPADVPPAGDTQTTQPDAPDSGGPVVTGLTIDLNINAASLNGLATLEPVVTGGDVVMGVEFYVDGVTLHTDFIPPYNFVVNTTTYADGPHTITVYTADNTGQHAEDEAIVTFDNSPPVFVKTIPAEGELIFYEDRPLTMELETDADSSIEYVWMRAAGFLVGEFFNPPFLLQKAWDGIYVFEDQLPATVNVRFYARDVLGLQSEVAYNVTVHRRFGWEYEHVGGQIWTTAVAFANGNIAYATATAGNSGHFVILNPDGGLVAEYDIGGLGAVRTPIVYDSANDRVLVTTMGGHVISFNSSAGLVWDNSTTSSLASIAVYGSHVYALTLNGVIRVINTSDGSDAWAVGPITSNLVFGRLALDDSGRAYFGDSSGELYCVTQEGVQWSKKTGERVDGRPIIAPDGVVYFGSADGFLYAQNADGTDVWKTDIDGELACNMHRDPETGDLFVLSGLKDMIRVEAATGNELWTIPVEGWVQTTGIAVGPDGTLYAAGALGRVFAVDPENGSILWSYELATESDDVKDEQFYAAPFISGGKLYIGNENTFFYAVNLEAPADAGTE